MIILGCEMGVPPFKETPISKNLQFFTLNEGVPTSMAHCRFRVATASLQALGKRWKTGEDLGMLIFEKPWVYESCVFWKVSRSGWFWWNNQIQQIPKQQNLTFFWYKKKTHPSCQTHNANLDEFHESGSEKKVISQKNSEWTELDFPERHGTASA